MSTAHANGATRVAATPVAAAALGELPALGTIEDDIVLRSGRRRPGSVPQFPSADLVVERIAANGARELLFFCDAVGEVQAARARATGDDVEVVFTTRSAAGEIAAYQARGPAVPARSAVRWGRLPDLPAKLGLAGAIAGKCNGALIVAGGTNFPDVPFAEGGTKTWYADVYALPLEGGGWRRIGSLPRPRAHAVSLSVDGGVLVVGGQHGNEVFADSFLLCCDNGEVRRTALPALPHSLTMSAGVVHEGVVYVAGGYAAMPANEARPVFWRLDLRASRPAWEVLPAWPGPPRAQAAMAAAGDEIYLMSGVNLVAGADGKPSAVYLCDAYRFRPGEGWATLPDLPWSVVAAPSPAPTDPAGERFFVLGGVDGRLVGKLPREAPLPNDVLTFDRDAGCWRLAEFAFPAATVTSPAVRDGERWIFPSGEIRAGVRTPQVWTMSWPDAEGETR